MSWRDAARLRLPQHLDACGDLRPPWAEFPTYERYCLGWRMGAGEDWLGLWGIFLEGLATDRGTRLAYLRRHPPAPVNWSESVYRVLNPEWGGDSDEDETEDEDRGDVPDPIAVRREELRGLGLIASDASYAIWRSRQAETRWPWEDCRSPATAGRYWTRDLWFWSRRVAEARADGTLTVPKAPWPWRGCIAPLHTGRLVRFERRRGLLTLVRMLCAGAVVPPWRLGLKVDDFADTFDRDMGYVDAWRLWGMSAFDDRGMMQRFGHIDEAPTAWRAWMDAQFYLD